MTWPIFPPHEEPPVLLYRSDGSQENYRVGQSNLLILKFNKRKNYADVHLIL
jgi:hypothetical protein